MWYFLQNSNRRSASHCPTRLLPSASAISNLEKIIKGGKTDRMAPIRSVSNLIKLFKISLQFVKVKSYFRDLQLCNPRIWWLKEKNVVTYQSSIIHDPHKCPTPIDFSYFSLTWVFSLCSWLARGRGRGVFARMSTHFLFLFLCTRGREH